MQILTFVNTNIGVVALRRHDKAENLYFTQVWLRSNTGEWKKYHYFTREKNADICPGILESIYNHVSHEEQLPYEDWW
jgi:hypothetical protein